MRAEFDRPEHPPRVIVLSTLHQFHEQVECYGYAVLERIIRRLSPDVLLLEVSQEDLDARAHEQVKREYPAVVYPLIDALRIPAYPLEPSGEIRDMLIRRKRAAEQTLQESGKYEDCASFLQQWLDDLFANWSTPADVNSARTDAEVLSKNEAMHALYAPDYALVWDEWNQHFLDRIAQVIECDRPRLTLVLVGLAHSYWLKRRLAECPGLELVDEPHLSFT